MLNTNILVVLSRCDGMIIEYSFDISDEKRNELITKHNIDVENDYEVDSWFKQTTLGELLNNKLKLGYDFNDQ
jgi:hypothetical protein